MRDHLDDLREASGVAGPDSANTPVALRPVVVTFVDDLQRVDEYRRHLGIDFPVVVDRERLLYRALGVERGRRRDVWSPGTLRMYVDLIRRGRRPRFPVDDTRQLGADALVGPDGRLEALWRPASPDDRPGVAEIARAVAEVSGGGSGGVSGG